MEYILLWTAFTLFFVLVIAAFVVRGTKRRVLKQKQMHPYLREERQEP